MVDDHSNDDEDVKSLAAEIALYLTEREQAADTIDGIVHWWILRQRLYEERRRVEKAMEYLCSQGLVNVRELPDGKILYTVARVC